MPAVATLKRVGRGSILMHRIDEKLRKRSPKTFHALYIRGLVQKKTSKVGGGQAVISTMGQEVTDGEAFVFVNGNRRRCKILWFDGTGLCLLAKRLDVGRFSAPWHVESKGELI
ncbi:MAG: IS66 family insertion sequence element accessory protein TnpB, partial [Deltaproteobacteria bacterium]|nr:IS66 family insertion sequence element accessory protein TnpB [Deltaproteobacteria bacterium]